jgi:Na+-translocating ferredoxin:NAD+ oxidoreductase RnfA subunit
MNVLNLLPAFIVVAVIMVVLFTELIKQFDKKNLLKGYRVYIPLALSAGAAALLKIGNFFASEQFWFWWAVIFGFSVFAFETILKRISAVLDKQSDVFF